MSQKYSHLNTATERTESDWNTKFMQKQHTPAAFQNSITSNIILTVEKMLSLASAQIKQLTNYRKF